MTILLLFLSLFTMASSDAQEASVIIGGTYPDGSPVTEVEVWSPSTECSINIKDTPVVFEDLQF